MSLFDAERHEVVYVCICLHVCLRFDDLDGCRVAREVYSLVYMWHLFVLSLDLNGFGGMPAGNERVCKVVEADKGH
jgi:hypothetical protein